MKSKVIAYLLWLFLGIVSAHRFYLKKYRSAILYLCTFQLLGVGWIIDSFILDKMVFRYNIKHRYYGPIRGLDQSVIVKIEKGDRKAQTSQQGHSVAS